LWASLGLPPIASQFPELASMHQEFSFVLSLPEYVKNITRKYGSIRWCEKRESIVLAFKDEYLLRAFVSFAKDYDLWEQPPLKGTKVVYEVLKNA
jgi:uncharacterized protein with von Willebrand factor type A (vWA) domain